MSSGLPSESRLLKRAAAKSRIPEAASELLGDVSSPRRRLLLEALLEPAESTPTKFTPASNDWGIFPFRDVAPGLENPGKQQSAR